MTGKRRFGNPACGHTAMEVDMIKDLKTQLNIVTAGCKWVPPNIDKKLNVFNVQNKKLFTTHKPYHKYN